MSQQGQWQVAGGAPEVYERELVPAVFGVWAPILVDLARPRPGERVLDVACGTGIVARIAAARVGPTGSVVGVDLNPGMLSVARSVVSTDVANWACNSLPIGTRPCAKCAEFLTPKEGSH